MLGNPSKKSLPDVSVVLSSVARTAEPPRPLGKPGRELWDRALEHTPWLADTDLEYLAVICEALDERTLLRGAVLADNDTGSMRRALRALDEQILRGFNHLGWSPSARTSLALGEVAIRRGVQELSEIGHSESVEKEVIAVDG
jgi:hypothetical protein